MRIIINADDFGYSEDTVKATIDCFEGGALTSATIMPNMPATSQAIAFARDHGEFSFGVHLTFESTGSERPISSASEIPDLLQGNGQFLTSRQMRAKAMLGRLTVSQIEREIERQIEHLLDNGVCVSHVDSHGHMHKYPPFLQALRRVLGRYGITKVRSVQDVYLKAKWLSPTFWLGARWRQRIRRDFVTTDHFYMPTSTGDRIWGTDILKTLKGDTLEIGLHPGYEESWRNAERVTVQSFAKAIDRESCRLISWRELAATNA